MTKNVTTYPEMNEAIVHVLRTSDQPIKHYAAARIEGLEVQLVQLAAAAREVADELRDWSECTMSITRANNLTRLAAKLEAAIRRAE